MAIPSIPAVPAGQTADVDRFLRAVKGQIETREGLLNPGAGSYLQANVTFQDLIDMGIITPSEAQTQWRRRNA
jgi:hypothetical protein